jgi:hypothetical protein
VLDVAQISANPILGNITTGLPGTRIVLAEIGQKLTELHPPHPTADHEPLDFHATRFEDVGEPHTEITLRTLPWETNAKWVALAGSGRTCRSR